MKKIVCCMLLLAASQGWADEVSAGGWSGDVALGYTRKTGNTTSTAASVDAKAVLDLGEWKHTGTAEYDFESQDRQTTEDKAYLTWQSDYRLDEVQYLYGFGSFKDDRYGGIDEEFVLSAGYGRVLVDDATFHLEMDAGPGYRTTNPTQGAVRNDLIARFGERFGWKLSDSADFKQNLSVETGGGNTTSKFTAALETRIVENIGLRLEYQVENVHKVPDHRHQTDTKTMVSLVYRFE